MDGSTGTYHTQFGDLTPAKYFVNVCQLRCLFSFCASASQRIRGETLLERSVKAQTKRPSPVMYEIRLGYE